jgi:hypothetical protein
MTRKFLALILAGTVVGFAMPAVAGDFGLWRAPSDHAQASGSGTSASYNPSINGTAGSGKATSTEGDAISSRTGLQNAALNMAQITSSGQASPQGTPGQ